VLLPLRRPIDDSSPDDADALITGPASSSDALGVGSGLHPGACAATLACGGTRPRSPTSTNHTSSAPVTPCITRTCRRGSTGASGGVYAADEHKVLRIPAIGPSELKPDRGKCTTEPTTTTRALLRECRTKAAALQARDHTRQPSTSEKPPSGGFSLSLSSPLSSHLFEVRHDRPSWSTLPPGPRIILLPRVGVL
jgi:hypothetical protein